MYTTVTNLWLCDLTALGSETQSQSLGIVMRPCLYTMLLIIQTRPYTTITILGLCDCTFCRHSD